MRRGRLSRRTLLKGAGATVVLVASGGVWRSVDQGVVDPTGGAAYDPWDNWRAEGERGPLALVSAAILAANAHNTQPWRFRVEDAVEDTRIDLFADRTRHIGAVDPFAREQDISLGCALENLLLAAPAQGYDARLTLAPDPADPTHAARVDLMPGSTDVSALYEAIPRRHTNRYAYDTSRPVAPETLDALQALGVDESDVKVFWFAEEDVRRRMGGLLVEAAEVMNADEEQSFDNLQRWLRHDQDAVQRHRDGLPLDVLGASTFEVIAGKLLPEPSLSSSEDVWLEAHRRQTETAAAFGTLAVRDGGDAAQRMRVGRLWQRMHLWMTHEGLAAQPMNQLHERADREVQMEIAPRFGDALTDLIGDPSWQGAFTFRLGSPTEQAPPSPRRAVTDVVAPQ